MKKNILILCAFFISAFAEAQGLENIIVEKYYVSDANDALANGVGGVLPVGSVTYRIYVDMLPGYKFQAAYGVPGHEMRIETTTLFFNNEDRGASTPTYTKNQAKTSTVMLDSWVSVGAACTGNFGIMKSADDGVATVSNTFVPQVLQNADPSAGIPLTQEDGLIAGSPESVTFVGISNEVGVFADQNDGTNGPLFSTSNGSWASLNGSMGPDPSDNKVLIAQITTDGVFSFELNIQIGTPVGGVENYVAHNPVGNEIEYANLIYNSLTTNISPINSLASVLDIYPNPTSGLFNLKINAQKKNTGTSYLIYDSQGKLISHKDLGLIENNYIETIDLSYLNSGIYFIELISGEEISMKKLIRN